MKHYIEELKRQLHEIMERPVTLGRAEEVTVYADAICALHKLDDDHFRESTKMMEFTREDAEKWVSHMENGGRHDRRTLDKGADGRRGQYHRCQCEVLRLVGGNEHDVFGLLFRGVEIRP